MMQLRLMDKVQVCLQVWAEGGEKKRSEGKEQGPGCRMGPVKLTQQA